MPRPAATGSDFAERLDVALKALNLSRAQLASQVGVDKSLVSRWLSGQMKPTGHNLSRISEVLAKAKPGFNTLLWERRRAEFDAFLGIAAAPEPAPQTMAEPASASSLTQPRLASFWRPSKTATWIALAVVAALAVGGSFIFLPRLSGAKPSEAPAVAAGPDASIAVMPFVNLSGDASREFFSDGFSVELLNTLANSPGLTVAARTDSFAFRDRRATTAEMARQLKVRYLLEGSVRENGNRIRVGVELIDTRTGRPVWSQQYDRNLTDVLKMQDEIARTIAGQLTHRLLPAAAAKPIDPEVYRTYLQALNYVDAYTPEGMTRAIGLLEEVTRRQPDFAEGFAILGVAHANLADLDRRRFDHNFAAEAALKRALAIDPDLPRGLLFMTGLSVRLWRWQEAMTYGGRLRASNAPEDLKDHADSLILDALALFPQMRDVTEATVRDAPDDAMLRYGYGWVLGVMGEYVKALDQTREGLVLLPNNTRLQGLQCFQLGMLGRLREARAMEARLREAFRDRPIGDELGMCSAAIANKTGDRAALRAVADRMAREYPGEGGVPARSIGLYYQQALAFDEAMVWYRKAYDQREYDLMQIPYLRSDQLTPEGRRLFDDPRWKALWGTPEIRAWMAARESFTRRR